jgi:hypothetical protein
MEVKEVNSVKNLVKNYVPFREGARLLIAASSGSGKTHFITKLISHKSTYFEVEPRKILFCVHPGTKDFDKSQFQNLDIEIVFGIPKEDENLEPHTLLVFDDLLSGTDAEYYLGFMLPYFTRRAHHEKLYVIATSQSLYSPLRHFRLISQNINYLVVLKSHRSLQQLRYLAQQIIGTGISKQIAEIYKLATKDRDFAHILFDLHPQTDDRIKYQSNIFKENGLPVVVYQLPE